MAYYATIVTTLGALALVAVALAVALVLGLGVAGPRDRLMDALLGQERHPIGWACAVATVAMAGSLYLSEVAGLIPCALCWYQRIAMYPLVFVLGVGALRGDVGVWRYGLPLAAIGFAISVYHVTIQWIPNAEVGSCGFGPPCSGRYLAVFGFISIPTMAGAAFLLLISLMLLLRELGREGASATEGPS